MRLCLCVSSWVKILPSVSTLKPNSSYWTSGCSEGSFCRDNQMKCISLVADLLTSVNRSDVSVTWGQKLLWHFFCPASQLDILFSAVLLFIWAFFFLISTSLYLFSLYWHQIQRNTCKCLHISNKWSHIISLDGTWPKCPGATCLGWEQRMVHQGLVCRSLNTIKDP